ncbi:MAG: hypothetical protein Q8R29_01830 [bacterium]|nr:hypothetical protein [bacterium]
MKGLKKALAIFRGAAKNIDAYKNFIKEHGIRPDKVNNIADFKKIPLTDKRNYLLEYELPKLFARGKIPPMAYASSGSSGRPLFWFRGDDGEKAGTDIHEKIFKNIFNIHKNDSTLVVICFSMGVWVAGNYTLACCRDLARRGYNLTSISPGTEKEDIFNTLKDLAPKFKNLILAGYPPFIMDIINELPRRRITLKNDIRVLTAGDKFSEDWRATVLKTLKIKNFDYVISIYGSADAGIMGFETPLSIYLRRLAVKNPHIYKKLFGESSVLPALVQYNPEYIFFEEVGGEFVLTTETSAPLVRYNIHDTGRLFSYDDMIRVIKDGGLEKDAREQGLLVWKMPFLVVEGRSDVAVTFYALNIYPEHIKMSLEDKRISKLISGNYFIYNKTINKGRVQKLCLNLELAPGVETSQEIQVLTTNIFVENLKKVNSEFRKLHLSLESRVIPTVKIIPHGSGGLRAKNTKGLVQIGGKKAKFLV